MHISFLLVWYSQCILELLFCLNKLFNLGRTHQELKGWETALFYCSEGRQFSKEWRLFLVFISSFFLRAIRYILLLLLRRNIFTAALCNSERNHHHPAHTQRDLKCKIPWMKYLMLKHAHWITKGIRGGTSLLLQQKALTSQIHEITLWSNKMLCALPINEKMFLLCRGVASYLLNISEGGGLSLTGPPIVFQEGPV